MSVGVSSISVVVVNATRNARHGFGQISNSSNVMLRRSWHSSGMLSRSSAELSAAYAIAHRNLACGWVTRGPGQHSGHSQISSPPVVLSPALHVSYTTVYVPYYRNFHTATVAFEKESSKPSSQVEVTVKDLKEKAKAAGSPIAQDKKLEIAVRKSLGVRIKEEILHYYHGFRLLFIDTKICAKYVWRIVNGETLSRREHRQLIRTTSDLFRLVPFSVFVIIPFMELLLPVALKLFPEMLPSTFETANEKEAKMKKTLKVKLEMAKFLQKTLDNMAVEAKGRRSESAKEFVMFFEKIQNTGQGVSNEEIIKFSKLFEDEITLDSLSRPQLMALCRLLEMQPFGTNNFLRFQLQMKLRTLVADDKIIQQEGVDSLAVWELQQACRARGMRAYGMSQERLRQQLNQWLALSLNEKVPPSLLLLSRTLFLPDNVRPTDTLAATISTLPEEVATRTKAAIGKREGKIDNLTRLEVTQAEERKIAEDKKELERIVEEKKAKEEIAKKKAEEEAQRQEEAKQKAAEDTKADILLTEVEEVAQLPPSVNKILTEGVQVTKATVSASGEIEKVDKEALTDQAPVLEDRAEVLSEEVPKPVQEPAVVQAELTSKDLRDVGEALETIGVEKQMPILEEKELSVLKSELADYQEDLEDFEKALIDANINKKELRQSKAAKRLFSRVNKMIGRMEPVLKSLSKEKEYRQKIVESGEAKAKDKAELVNLEELARHMTYIYHAPDTSKVQIIHDVLAKMDFDHDGAVKVDHVLRVLGVIIMDEETGVSPKLVEDVIEMMAKEEKLETAELIQHALKNSGARESSQHSPSSGQMEQQSQDKFDDFPIDIVKKDMIQKTDDKEELYQKGISLDPSHGTEVEKQAKQSQ